MQPTFEHIDALLGYNPLTGELRWKSDSGHCNAGDRVGSVAAPGYVRLAIRVNGASKTFLAHRVAWLLHTGEWPKNMVDHVNGVRSDNRISNLREATRGENGRNRKPSARGSSKYLGVSFVPSSNKWCACIWGEGRNTHLGCFDSENDAAIMYNVAAVARDTNFNRLNVIT